MRDRLQQPHDALPDRNRFRLNAQQWEEFHAALAAPVRDCPRLVRLLREPSVFEQSDAKS